MKKTILALILAIVLSCSASASAEPVSSYLDVQERLLSAAYKVPKFDVALSGTVSDIVHSYTFKDLYYIFVMVDPNDVSMWSTEDDNYFVADYYLKEDTMPFEVGDSITVEGQVVSIYSSPVCPYIHTSSIYKPETN